MPWRDATSAVAASPGHHLLPPPHLAVVLAQLLRHVGHGGVADFHCVPVDHLSQLVSRGKAGVKQVQEPLTDVGGDGLGEGGVEPCDPPGPRPATGARGWRLREHQLVVVAGLVQGLLVGDHHCQELLLAAGEPAQSLIHCTGDVLEDAGWVVGHAVDVQEVGVWFGVSSE